MTDPSLQHGDPCICLDDPWSDVRSLVFKCESGGKAMVEDAFHLLNGNVSPVLVPADRLFLHPSRSEHEWSKTGRSATAEERRRHQQAMQVRVLTANAG